MSEGKVLRPGKPVKHGRFFHSRSRNCSRCDLKALCISKGRMTKSVVIGDHHPALLRARRRRERWSAEDNRLYQRHRWRSEGYHGEAKTWHGLVRAVRRGLQNMRIQAFLTAAAVNLKRLAAAVVVALLALLDAILVAIQTATARRFSRARYAALRARGHNHARALRSVADRLIAVACAMLETGTLFGPNRTRNAPC